MARYGQRPENALKRANEFMEIGKPARALDTLQEVFRNKKWAYNWSESVLEPIMFRYLELCVELRKSHIAKEGLFQYRNMFQSVNVGSLENVIRGYLRMAEERTEAAREQSAQAVIDIDDLDNLATPESILLSAVSGEDAQDRSDRTILTPWVKFLWESYCQCLELLRTNAHVENLYHDIARMAFQFCLKYARKTEFRKLCDKLRKHLEDICKLSVQTGNVSISKPETQQYNLETRLFQLDSAIQMELWQEAYKAIEDIHNLMNMSKKTPVAKTMANYYGKLALVFWKAGHCLFHAAALLKLFQLSREMKKNITPEELQRMACLVLVATLSIPLPSLHPEFDRFIETEKSPVEKAQRLAVLLGLQQPPTRASLLKEIVRLNVVSLASPELQDLYNWLEVEFDPLVLCKKVRVVVDTLEAEEGSQLCQYVTALRDVALIRLVRQAAQCYQSIRFSRLLELAVFADPFHLERLLVDCVRHNDMQIRIDHANKCIHFGVELSEASRETVPEGPFLQEMPSEQVRGQLMRAAAVLGRAAAVVAGPRRRRAERDRARALAVHHYHENKVKEHQRVLQRHKIIEDRKEYIERLNTVREEEEQRRQEEIARQQMQVEQMRLEVERGEREKRRQQSELQLIKDRHLKEKMQQISLTAHGQKVLKKLDEEDIKKIDADTIAQKEAEELMKERRELMARLKSQEKRIDYFERAKRIEEIPLLQKSLEEKRVNDQAFWEQQEEERITQLKEARELDLATATRLKRMATHRDEFVKRLTTERRVEHSTRVQAYEDLIKEERIKRLADRVQERLEQRRADWHLEKEAAANRKAEELERAREEEERRKFDEEEKIQQEAERIKREELALAKQEHDEMIERAAAKKRAREEEMERKKTEREKEQKSTPREGGGGGGGGPAVWRKANTGDSESPAAQEAAPAAPPATESSWRKAGDAPPADKKPEPWKPSRRDDREPRDKDDREERPAEKSEGWRRGDRKSPEREKRDDRDTEGNRFPDRERFIGRRDDRRDDRRGDDRRGDDRRGDDRRGDDRRGDDRRGDDRRGDDRRGDDRRGDDRRDDRERPDAGGSWRRNVSPSANAVSAPPATAERSTAWRSTPRDPPRDRDGAPRDRDIRTRDTPRGGGRDGGFQRDRDAGPRNTPRDGPRDRERERDGPRDKDGARDKEAPRRPPPAAAASKDEPRDSEEWQPVKRR